MIKLQWDIDSSGRFPFCFQTMTFNILLTGCGHGSQNTGLNWLPSKTFTLYLLLELCLPCHGRKHAKIDPKKPSSKTIVYNCTFTVVIKCSLRVSLRGMYMQSNRSKRSNKSNLLTKLAVFYTECNISHSHRCLLKIKHEVMLKWTMYFSWGSLSWN